jgi:BirA family biotin operon repressor/biotin-[acetyl-CoA-carboxylase] ligase
MVSAMSRLTFTDVRRFETIDSTNRYLVDKAREGEPEGVVAVASFQTAGRGRLGRTWEAPPDASLLMSVLVRPSLDVADLHLCTTLVALAAVRACDTVAGVGAGIKWPNDLVVEDRKVAGVLSELVTAPGAAAPPGAGLAVVVGIGINIRYAGPEGVGGTSLEHEAGRPVDREAVLQALLDDLAASRGDLDSAPGRVALAGRAREACTTLGRRVRVTLSGEAEGDPGASLVGTAVDLTSEGHLVVESEADGSARTIAAGDVVHLRPEPTP